MRRVSNLNTLRIGIFGTWYSLWYDKEYYTFLVYKDYKLIEYLNSIFYRLRLPTSHFYLNRVNHNYYYIQSNIHLTKPNFNRFTKILVSNKIIFKYISILEYLFDFSLLLPTKTVKDKDVVGNAMVENQKYYSYNYYFFYSVLKFTKIYNYSFFYIYSYYNKINIYFLLKDINVFFYNLNNNEIEKTALSFLNDNNVSNNNSFSILNNVFSINKNTMSRKIELKTKLKFDFQNIKSFFINSFSYFNSNKNFIYFYLNLNFSYLLKSFSNFFLKNSIKLFSFYLILFSNIKKNKQFSIHKFLNFYYKYYFFLKKNNIYNNYFLKLVKNNYLYNFINNMSINLSIINKDSYFSYSNSKFKKNIQGKEYLPYKLNKFIFNSVSNQYGFISSFYLKDFSSYAKEYVKNSLRIKKETIDMVYFKRINRYNKFIKRVIFFFKKRYFLNFSNFIEKSLFYYTGIKSFFLPTYYVKSFPPFDSKLITDYICYNLKKKHKITRILKKISYIQKKSNSNVKKIFIPFFNELEHLNNNYLDKIKYISFFNFNNLFNTVFFNKIFNKEIINKYNPVTGIRIEFSGPPKKAKMSKTIAYHSVVHDYKLIGKMPTHTIYADIHYYQSNVKLKRSSFGIKVWLFFSTRILNSNNVNKTIL